MCVCGGGGGGGVPSRRVGVESLKHGYREMSSVSCGYLLELDVRVFSSFDRSGTTGFKYSSLRASQLTVLRVVYAIVGFPVLEIPRFRDSPF